MSILIDCQVVNFRNKNRTGFTLAEVLLTLTIIGIVAALTITALTQGTQDSQYKTAWKEAFSIVSQASLKIRSDQGTGTLLGLCSNNNCFKNVFANYVSYIKQADTQSYGKCWEADWKFLNGNAGLNLNANPCLALNNGMYALFTGASEDCSYDGATGGTVRMCGLIYIDVNGSKEPNIMGRDIFQAYIQEYTVKPAGIPPISGSCMNSCDPTRLGFSCAYEYLKQ